MRFSIYLRFFRLRMGVVCCVAATAASLYAQSPNPIAILELNACGDLKVFEDGKVLESRGGKTTERRLSESRLRRLHKLIAGAPCEREWKPRPAEPPDLHSRQIPTINEGSDCDLEHLGYGKGLIEVRVNLHYLEKQTGPFPVYIVCAHARRSAKDEARRSYQRVLKRSWQRFLKDVVAATDSKHILTDCECWK